MKKLLKETLYFLLFMLVSCIYIVLFYLLMEYDLQIEKITNANVVKVLYFLMLVLPFAPLLHSEISPNTKTK